MLTFLLTSVLAAAGTAQAGGHAPSVAIASAVHDPNRPPSDTRTDVGRKPAETLALAGVRSRMIIGEFYPSGGYFTRLLSDVVGPRGHVYGLENAGWRGAVAADQALLTDRRLANVSIEALPFGTVHFPQPLDMAWVSQNYHDLKIAEFGRVDTATFNRAVFTALKPGGVYIVIDHQAPPAADLAVITRLHRIEKAQVIREVTAAGFRLQAQGDFLHHADDDHRLPVSDARVRGRTDQYVLKFLKPRS